MHNYEYMPDEDSPFLTHVPKKTLSGQKLPYHNWSPPKEGVQSAYISTGWTSMNHHVAKRKGKAKASTSAVVEHLAVTRSNVERVLTNPGIYQDPHGGSWFGEKRVFENIPICTLHSLGDVNHVMKWLTPTKGNIPWDDHLKWPRLFDRRCDLECYCHWHGLPVPQAKSVIFCKDPNKDNEKCLQLLQREIAQMEKRLERWHAKYLINTELDDPMYASDKDLPDYKGAKTDMDLVHHLPTMLMGDENAIPNSK